MDSISILSVRVDNVDYGEAAERVRGFLQARGLHQIATVNPEFVVMAQSRLEFRKVLNSTALNVPDGVGLMWAARELGRPLKERVTGQELVGRIAALACDRCEGIFLLGARRGIAERAAAALAARHPGLQVAGCWAGSPAAGDEEEIVERVNASGARILFVAYGPPKQELWIARNAARLDAAVAMGVGGTFDTLAGAVPRAPHWVQRAGFEWTFRLLREPRRLRRQLAIPYFMWLIWRRGKRDLPEA